MRKTKSVVSRQAAKTRKSKPTEEKFLRLQRKMARRARKKGIFTEKQVERLVFQDR